MQLLLRELETIKMPDKLTLIGQVKQENFTSASVFEKCGFTPIKRRIISNMNLFGGGEECELL